MAKREATETKEGKASAPKAREPAEPKAKASKAEARTAGRLAKAPVQVKRPAAPARPAALPTTGSRAVRRGNSKPNPLGHRNIGLDVPYPNARCDDVDCPFCGGLSVRGITLTGTVASAKMRNTVIISRQRLWKVPKFERYEKRTTRIAAHCPPCLGVKEGDTVTLAECRPLSKTVSFVVVQRHPET